MFADGNSTPRINCAMLPAGGNAGTPPVDRIATTCSPGSVIAFSAASSEGSSARPVGNFLECGNHLGEGPVWDVDEGCLYWLDGTGRRVGNPSIWRLDPRTGKTCRWSLAHDVGAMALRQRGGAVLALADGFYFYDFTTGAL